MAIFLEPIGFITNRPCPFCRKGEKLSVEMQEEKARRSKIWRGIECRQNVEFAVDGKRHRDTCICCGAAGPPGKDRDEAFNNYFQDTFDLLARIYELDQTSYRQRLGQLVELFEIGEHLSTPVRKLSLGERMRCEIAASLIHRPQVIFLDEPTIGLDVVVKHHIRELILRLNEEEQVTVFLTSHDAGDVERLCRRAMVINHGEVIYDGRVSTLRRDYIRTKTVSLKLGEPWQGVDRSGRSDVPGVQVLKHKGYGVKLEVDTGVVPIEEVVGQLLGQYAIADITVDNPPMEEIIARIYTQRET